MFLMIYPTYSCEEKHQSCNTFSSDYYDGIEKVVEIYRGFNEFTRELTKIYDLSAIPQVISLESHVEYETGILQNDDVIGDGDE